MAPKSNAPTDAAIGDAILVPDFSPMRAPGSVLVMSAPGANAKTDFAPQLLNRARPLFAVEAPIAMTPGNLVGTGGLSSDWSPSFPAEVKIIIPEAFAAAKASRRA